MSTSTQWQLAQDAAERYETILTPTILGPFARVLVAAAQLQANESVVDVGCGTGAAARRAAQQVGSGGTVVGIDVNPGMLAVAQSLPPVAGAAITWREANATALPLDDQSADAVLCAQTLQFLPDKEAALREMGRIIKEDGRVALSLWSPIAESPYFAALVRAVGTHIGAGVAVGLLSAFALSDADAIRRLCADAGFSQVELARKGLDLVLPRLTDFVPRHISATPMAAGFQQADPATQTQVIDTVCTELAPYGTGDVVPIPFTSYVILARL